jgi:hypothetical protein
MNQVTTVNMYANNNLGSHKLMVTGGGDSGDSSDSGSGEIFHQK